MIRDLKLNGKFILAPMAGVNDIAFRLLCQKYGVAMTCSEMINVNAIERKNKATIRMAYNPEIERPYCVQLFGTRLEAIKKTIKYLENDCENVNPDMFDFNFGCPVRKVMNVGAGSALLRRPSKIGDIISTMRSSTDLAICGKIRLGINKKGANYVKTARIIEEAGADTIAVHGRYQEQGYSGTADWNAIKEIVEAVNIPVIGNGDVTNEQKGSEIFEKTGCKYAMIGRAALGNPFIFERLNTFLDSGNTVRQKSKLEMFVDYMNLAKEFSVKNSFIKQHIMYFTRGIEGGAKLRNEMSKLNNIDEMLEAFRKHENNY